LFFIFNTLGFFLWYSLFRYVQQMTPNKDQPQSSSSLSSSVPVFEPLHSSTYSLSATFPMSKPPSSYVERNIISELEKDVKIVERQIAGDRARVSYDYILKITRELYINSNHSALHEILGYVKMKHIQIHNSTTVPTVQATKTNKNLEYVAYGFIFVILFACLKATPLGDHTMATFAVTTIVYILSFCRWNIA
jgi:hypothetical protein